MVELECEFSTRVDCWAYCAGFNGHLMVSLIDKQVSLATPEDQVNTFVICLQHQGLTSADDGSCCCLFIISGFTFFLLDLLLWSESDELSSLVSMNSRLLKLSLPPPRSLSLSPPEDFLFFSSFLPPDFLLSLTEWNWKADVLKSSHVKRQEQKHFTAATPYFLEDDPPPLSVYSFFNLSYCLLASPAFVSHSYMKEKQENWGKLTGQMKWQCKHD